MSRPTTPTSEFFSNFEGFLKKFKITTENDKDQEILTLSNLDSGRIRKFIVKKVDENSLFRRSSSKKSLKSLKDHNENKSKRNGSVKKQKKKEQKEQKEQKKEQQLQDDGKKRRSSTSSLHSLKRFGSRKSLTSIKSTSSRKSKSSFGSAKFKLGWGSSSSSPSASDSDDPFETVSHKSVDMTAKDRDDEKDPGFANQELVNIDFEDEGSVEEEGGEKRGGGDPSSPPTPREDGMESKMTAGDSSDTASLTSLDTSSPSSSPRFNLKMSPVPKRSRNSKTDPRTSPLSFRSGYQSNRSSISSNRKGILKKTNSCTTINMEMANLSRPESPMQNSKSVESFEETYTNGDVTVPFTRAGTNPRLKHQRSFNRVKFILDSGRPDNITGDYDDIKIQKNDKTDKSKILDQSGGSSGGSRNGLSRSGRKCLVFSAGLLIMTMAVILGSFFGSRKGNVRPKTAAIKLNYIPFAMQGQFKILNENFAPFLKDYESAEFKKMSNTLEEFMVKAIFVEESANQSNSTIKLRIVKYEKGSVISIFRIKWEKEPTLERAEIRKRIIKYLENYGAFGDFRVDKSSIFISGLKDLCDGRTQSCTHFCILSESTLRFVCSCPDNLMLINKTNCTPPQTKPKRFDPHIVNQILQTKNVNRLFRINAETVTEIKEDKDQSKDKEKKKEGEGEDKDVRRLGGTLSIKPKDVTKIKEDKDKSKTGDEEKEKGEGEDKDDAKVEDEPKEEKVSPETPQDVKEQTETSVAVTNVTEVVKKDNVAESSVSVTLDSEKETNKTDVETSQPVSPAEDVEPKEEILEGENVPSEIADVEEHTEIPTEIPDVEEQSEMPPEISEIEEIIETPTEIADVEDQTEIPLDMTDVQEQIEISEVDDVIHENIEDEIHIQVPNTVDEKEETTNTIPEEDREIEDMNSEDVVSPSGEKVEEMSESEKIPADSIDVVGHTEIYLLESHSGNEGLEKDNATTIHVPSPTNTSDEASKKHVTEHKMVEDHVSNNDVSQVEDQAPTEPKEQTPDQDEKPSKSTDVKKHPETDVKPSTETSVSDSNIETNLKDESVTNIPRPPTLDETEETNNENVEENKEVEKEKSKDDGSDLKDKTPVEEPNDEISEVNINTIDSEDTGVKENTTIPVPDPDTVNIELEKKNATEIKIFATSDIDKKMESTDYQEDTKVENLPSESDIVDSRNKTSVKPKEEISKEDSLPDAIPDTKEHLEIVELDLGKETEFSASLSYNHARKETPAEMDKETKNLADNSTSNDIIQTPVTNGTEITYGILSDNSNTTEHRRDGDVVIIVTIDPETHLTGAPDLAVVPENATSVHVPIVPLSDDENKSSTTKVETTSQTSVATIPSTTSVVNYVLNSAQNKTVTSKPENTIEYESSDTKVAMDDTPKVETNKTIEFIGVTNDTVENDASHSTTITTDHPKKVILVLPLPTSEPVNKEELQPNKTTVYPKKEIVTVQGIPIEQAEPSDVTRKTTPTTTTTSTTSPSSLASSISAVPSQTSETSSVLPSVGTEGPKTDFKIDFGLISNVSHDLSVPGEAPKEHTEIVHEKSEHTGEVVPADVPDVKEDQDTKDVTSSSSTNPPLNASTTTTTAIPEPACEQGEFLCTDRTCIPSSSRCDSVFDCLDHSDEEACIENKCRDNYQCRWNGDCLARNFVCDGIKHCTQGEDEEGCETWKCSPTEHKCGPGSPSLCIPLDRKCDGQPDCFNRTDEFNCTTECPTKDQFFCPEGTCIPTMWKCDGKEDCLQGEDEYDCGCEGLDQSSCNVGGCVPTFKLCDGLRQCPDGSDEWGCLKIDNDTKQLQVRSSEGRWSAVCGDKWTAQWTDLVCEQLGFDVSLSTEVRRDTEAVLRPRVKLSPDAPEVSRRGRAPLQYFLTHGECARDPLVHVSCKMPECGQWNASSVPSQASHRRSQTASPWPSLGLLIQPDSYRDSSLVESTYACAASIITPAWALTSYSCLASKSNGLEAEKWALLVGELSPKAGEGNTQLKYAKQIVIYPGAKRAYNLWVGDAALLRLQTPLAFGPSIQPICLADEPMESHDRCVFATWKTGDRHREGANGMEVMREQSIQTLPFPNLTVNTCNTSYYQGQLSKEHACASLLQDKNSPCVGNEGAPLMCRKKNESWKLHGLLSHIGHCASFNLPSIFTDISSVHSWIFSTIGRSIPTKTTIPSTTTTTTTTTTPSSTESTSTLAQVIHVVDSEATSKSVTSAFILNTGGEPPSSESKVSHDSSTRSAISRDTL